MMHDSSYRREERMASWLKASADRRSRREFDGVAALPQTIDSLTETCEGFRPFGDARVAVVADPPLDAFRGFLGLYGKVTGAPHVLVIIANERSRASQAHAGYVGEAAVLEATSLGLDTCWVGGFFDPKKANRLTDLGSGERIVALSPVGFASRELTGTERTMGAMAGSHRRKRIDEIATGASRWPGWARAAAECARIAPSAMNRQPWRLRLEEGSLIVARDNGFETPRVTKALDCGIAMLHVELGASGEGVSGEWTDIDSGRDVARFTPAFEGSQ